MHSSFFLSCSTASGNFATSDCYKTITTVSVIASQTCLFDLVFETWLLTEFSPSKLRRRRWFNSTVFILDDSQSKPARPAVALLLLQCRLLNYKRNLSGLETAKTSPEPAIKSPSNTPAGSTTPPKRATTTKADSTSRLARSRNVNHGVLI